MKRITWGDGLMLSVPQMDQEHEALITLAKEFMAAVSAEASRAELEIRLTDLIAAFQSHFQSEEKLMHSAAFSGLPSHEREHTRLIEQMSGLRDDVGSGDISLCEALSAFVRVWVEQHIKGPDAAFAAFLTAASRGETRSASR